MTLLQVAALKADLGRRQVLHDVSLALSRGEFVGLIGPNGAGKSTLLRAIMGFLPDARGEILVNGRDAAGISATERAREVAYLPQEREIAWAVPVEDVVALGRLPHRPALARSTATDRTAVETAMRRMDVGELRKRRATDLSGGEKARVLIARALAQEAALVLADEPTAGLDPSHQIAAMRIFRGLAAEGSGVVASLHDLGLAARWCTRLVLLDGGRIVADGSPEAVLTHDRLRRVYGIEAFIAQLPEGLMVQPLDTTKEEPKDERTE